MTRTCAQPMAKLQAAINAMIDAPSSAPSPLYLTVGDSTSFGKAAGSNTGPSTSNEFTDGARALSTTAQMALSLAFPSIEISTDAFFGSGNADSAADYANYFIGSACKLGIQSGWNKDTVIGLAGPILSFGPSGASGSLIYTTELSCDEFLIYTPVSSTMTGQLEFRVDGAPATILGQSQNTGGPAGVQCQIIPAGAPGNAGIHTIEIFPHDPTVKSYFLGLIARNSGKARLIVINGGWRGSTTTNWISTAKPWSPLNMIKQLAPTAGDVSLGINDFKGGGTLSASTFMNNVTSIANAIALSGDVIMRSPNDIADSQDTGTLSMEEVGDEFYAFASAKLPVPYSFVDTIGELGDYDQLNALGQMRDVFHPTSVPFAKLGKVLASVIQQGANTSSGPPSQPDTIFSDDFAGAPDGALDGREVDTGSWSATNFNISSNTIYGSTSGARALISTDADLPDHYVIGGTFIFKSFGPAPTYSSSSTFLSVNNISSTKFYVGGWRSSTHQWEILKYSGGSSSIVGSTASASPLPVAGASYNVELEVENVGGSVVLTLSVNGVQVATATDTSGTIPTGDGGVYAPQTSTVSAGVHLDAIYINLPE